MKLRSTVEHCVTLPITDASMVIYSRRDLSVTRRGCRGAQGLTGYALGGMLARRGKRGGQTRQLRLVDDAAHQDGSPVTTVYTRVSFHSYGFAELVTSAAACRRARGEAKSAQSGSTSPRPCAHRVREADLRTCWGHKVCQRGCGGDGQLAELTSWECNRLIPTPSVAIVPHVHLAIHRLLLIKASCFRCSRGSHHCLATTSASPDKRRGSSELTLHPHIPLPLIIRGDVGRLWIRPRHA